MRSVFWHPLARLSHIRFSFPFGIKFLQLISAFLCKLIKHLEILSALDRLYALFQMFCRRQDILAVQPPDKHCSRKLRNLRRTAGCAESAHYAVKALDCSALQIAPLHQRDIIHDINIHRACPCACAAANALENFWI